MTKPRRYRRFSSEFKREAIISASEECMTDKAVCDVLGVSTRQFRRRRDELALFGKDAIPGSFASGLASIAAVGCCGGGVAEG